MYLVIVALGKPKINTMLGSVLLLVTLPTIVYASLHYGIVGAAWAHFFSALLGLTGISLVFNRITQIRMGSLVTTLWRPAIAAVIMASTLFMLDAWLVAGPESSLAINRLLILVVAGVGIYVAAILLLWTIAGRPKGAEGILLATLKERLARQSTGRSR